jgi:hypothetical protein
MILATVESRIVVSSAQPPDRIMEREDIDPWYRQFWPWFIIALPASAVVAGLYTLWIAMQTTDSLVVRSDDGMNVVTERNLAAENEAERLGISASFEIQMETGAVVVTLLSVATIDPASSLELRMRHPTMASRDAVIELLPAIPNTNGDPVWAGHFIATPMGRFFLTLSSGDNWRLSAEWSGQSQFQLSPAGLSDNGSL